MKVSIITVTYNAAPLLSKTIESVVTQIFSDYEYLIIDGKSTDDTEGLLANYLDKYPNTINFTSEKDDGIYDAMNKGLKKASGEYVIFLNAGDTFINEDVLENIFSSAITDADIIYGKTMLAKQSGEEIGLRGEVTTRRLPIQLTKEDMKLGMVVCHQSILVKRKIAPLYIPNNLSADIDWVINCLDRSKQTYYHDKVISKFLIGGISDQKKIKSLTDRFKVITSHFGIWGAVFAHLSIVKRYLLHKVS